MDGGWGYEYLFSGLTEFKCRFVLRNGILQVFLKLLEQQVRRFVLFEPRVRLLSYLALLLHEKQLLPLHIGDIYFGKYSHHFRFSFAKGLRVQRIGL